ncbi:MAG: hypothetical protein ABSE25_02025 [Syntrophorhabdales bacterium]|jgi:hypothetical protein
MSRDQSQERGAGLLVHLGGLGDVCLSESTILSVELQFGRLRAVGNKPVLDVFREYFTGVDSADRRSQAYLFSDSAPGPFLQRVIYIGKDRLGFFRKGLERLADEIFFIDMYPEGRAVPVEDYQLEQISRYGIKPVRKKTERKTGRLVILYPERPYKKKKWPVARFCEVWEHLRTQDVEVLLMRQPGLDLSGLPSFSFERLSDIAAFFSQGGIFVSNDSGMAHFAARCGLLPITLFFDADPVVWRPRGGKIIDCAGGPPPVEEIARLIAAAL